MKKILPLLVLLYLGVAQAAGPARVHENFNSGWLFARQSHGAGELGSFDRLNGEAAAVEPRFRDAPSPKYDDSSWQPVNLPHTWNAQDTTDDRPGYWRGIGWYRKHFRLDSRYAGKRLFVEFEAANSIAEVWLNGVRLGEHKGGYTGFEFDMTAAAHAGAENVLTVKVDNLFHDTVPPTVKTDYTFYGGIYRDVWLRVTDPVYVAGVTWSTPSVSRQSAEVKLDTRVTNTTGRARRLEVAQDIIDPRGRVVKSVSRTVEVLANATVPLAQDTTIAPPELWSPATPHVYQIRTTLFAADAPGGVARGAAIDSLEAPLGFRWFKFDAQRGFFLNGERLQIQGANWHQVYPGMGNALPNSRHWKDMELMRDMGLNFWRTSHYPHDVATIEASDRLGLMVWEELPINKEIGDPGEYIANVSNMAREMIARDRNHPSVILWGIAGEVNASKKTSLRVVEAISRLYRQLDPARPVVMHEPRGEDLEALVDVVALDVGPKTDAKHEKYPQRAFMIGEYAAALIGRGLYDGGENSEDHGAERHEKHLAELNRRPWMAGGCIWNEFDFEGETYDPVIPHVNSFGMADSWRIPKEVFYFYQSQWTSKPMVHIVGHWTWPGREGRAQPVKVYSNADTVELFLNGQSLGAQARTADAGLKNPPRVWQVTYEPGTLRAVARAANAEVADERKTAGAPFQIVLKSDAAQLVSGDSESLAYLTAVIADKDGTVVPSAHDAVSFSLYGPGELVEQTWPGYPTGLRWSAVAGMTRVAFRSTPRTGTAVISAYSPGLKMGRVEIKLAAPGKPDEMNYKERFEADELSDRK